MAEQASEAAIQSEILDYLVRTVPDWQGYFYRTEPQGGGGRHRSHSRDRGQPDITGVYLGQYIGLEVKTPKGAVRGSQVAFEQCITKPGGHYFIVRSVEDVAAALESVRGEG